MEAFTDFILQLTYPPNPIRNLDNSLTPQQQQGRDFFFGETERRRDRGVPAAATGSIRMATPSTASSVRASSAATADRASEVFPQIFKTPHLRNLYTKVGMFGFFNLDPFVETVSDPALEGFLGDQIRGFGTNRGGDFDRVFRFMHATTFSQSFLFGPNPEGIPPGPAGDPAAARRRGVRSRVRLEPEADCRPAGDARPRSLEPKRSHAPALLVARAEAGDCDLVAKGFAPSGPRGYLYTGAGWFRTDRAGDAAIDEATLRARHDGPNRSVTLTCTPPGSGVRIAIDRDEDGVLDGANDERKDRRLRPRQDDLPDDFPRRHHLQRLGGAVERKRRRDVRLQLALLEPLAELLHPRGEALRLAAREVAPEHADDRASFQQREVERNPRDVAGREPDDEQAAAPGGRSQRRLGVRPADRVVDDVDAAAAGDRLDPLAQVFGRRS